MRSTKSKKQTLATSAVLQHLPGSEKHALQKTVSEFFDNCNYDKCEEDLDYLLQIYLQSDEESAFHVANMVHKVRLIKNLILKLSQVNTVELIRKETISC